MICKKFLPLYLGALFAVCVQPLTFSQRSNSSQPRIRVSTDPSRVRNGEPVLFKIRIETGFNDRVEDINFPLDNPDWRFISSYRDHTTIVKFENAKNLSQRVVEFSYTLAPKKTGVLKIPELPFKVNGKEFKSFPTFVQVEKIRDSDLARRPRLTPPQNPPSRRGPFFPKAPPVDSFEDQLIDVPELDTHFVRGIPSKTTVFEGEFIDLSYRLMIRRMLRMENWTIFKFPDFKGFLKEELYVAKQFNPSPTMVRGEQFLDFELIRYGIFPLKPGALKIEPLRFRSTVFSSLLDPYEDPLTGNLRYSTTGIPMEKSSQEITIQVRPLPVPPANIKFGGAVGDYRISLVPPTGIVATNNPFNIQVVIEGQGNIKAIEEPTVMLPDDIEVRNVSTKYVFDENAKGSKSFDFVVVAKTPGKKKFPGVVWTYFDPLAAKYKTLTTSPFELDIIQGQAAPVPSAIVEVPEKWSTPDKEIQTIYAFERFQDLRGVAPWLRYLAWPSLVILYVLLFSLYFVQRKSEKFRSLLVEKRWLKTEYKLDKALKAKDVILAVTYIDLWVRQRLIYDRKLSFTDETDREELFRALGGDSAALREFFSQLDLIRFAQNKPDDKLSFTTSDAKSEFEKAKVIVENLNKPV
jgi:hypothetical protein